MGQGLPCSEQIEAFRSTGWGRGTMGTWLLALWVALGPASAQVVDLSGEWQMLLVPSVLEAAEPPAARDFEQGVALPGFVTVNGVSEIPGQTRRATEPVPDPKPGRRSGTVLDSASVRRVDLQTSPAVPRGVVWFSREVDVPGWWQGERVALSLESVSGETRVWVDGRAAGRWPADPNAPDLDLTEVLVPGRHRLVLRVENRLDSIAAGGTEGAVKPGRGPWLGILGRMELRASPKVRLDPVRVFRGNADRGLRLEVSIENLLAGVGTAGLRVEVESPSEPRGRRTLIHRSQVVLGYGRTEVAVEVPIPEPPPEPAREPSGFGRLRLSLSGAVLDRGVQHEATIAFRVPHSLLGKGPPPPWSDSGARGAGEEWTVDVAAVPEAPPAGVRVVHRFDEFARSELESGHSVLLLPDPNRRARVPSPAEELSHHAEHPVFRGIPSDASAVWYWRELLSGADWFLLEGIRGPESKGSGRVSGPALGWTGSGTNSEIRPLWLEARVGRGRLAIVSLDLETDLEHRPLTRAFRSRLLRYLGSGDFRPRTRIAAAKLASWLGATTNRGPTGGTP